MRYRSNVRYVGDLYWVWDLRGVPGQTWSAVEEGFGVYVLRDLAAVASKPAAPAP